MVCSFGGKLHFPININSGTAELILAIGSIEYHQTEGRRGKQRPGQSDQDRGAEEYAETRSSFSINTGQTLQCNLLCSGKQQQLLTLTEGFRLLDSDALAIFTASGEILELGIESSVSNQLRHMKSQYVSAAVFRAPPVVCTPRL